MRLPRDGAVRERTRPPIDPLGSSYYVEALTRELVDKAGEIIERVDEEGGMAKAVAA